MKWPLLYRLLRSDKVELIAQGKYRNPGNQVPDEEGVLGQQFQYVIDRCYDLLLELKVRTLLGEEPARLHIFR